MRLYYHNDYDHNIIGPLSVYISSQSNRVFNGSAYQFSCGTYPPELGAEIQLSVDGDIINVTVNDRIFSTFDGYAMQFTIEPSLLEDDGILLECVLQTPNGTLVSEGNIILLVLERLSMSLQL